MNWAFLFRVLEDFELNKMNKIVYTSQEAQIIINGDITKLYERQRIKRWQKDVSKFVWKEGKYKVIQSAKERG